jgi:hypothetical protein
MNRFSTKLDNQNENSFQKKSRSNKSRTVIPNYYDSGNYPGIFFICIPKATMNPIEANPLMIPRGTHSQ